MIFGEKRTFTVHTVGSDVLRKKAAPVTEITEELRSLAAYMFEAMNLFDGIGLAAPQVGKPIRLITLGISPEAMANPPSPGELQLLPEMPLALVNPEILSFGPETFSYDEGCLSVPELFAPVVRPRTIRVKAQLLNGKVVELDCAGMLARCLQHEIDHLDGILFIDHIEPEVQKKIASKLERLQKNCAKHSNLRTIKIR